MNPKITFIFDNHSVNISRDFAAALLEDALFSLMVQARLLRNRNETRMVNAWLVDCRVDDPGRNMKAPAPVVTVDEKLNDIFEELFNANVGKYRLGGYPCYNESKKRWKWSTDRYQIATEMNRSHMFDFYVSPMHIKAAQARLRAGQ